VLVFIGHAACDWGAIILPDVADGHPFDAAWEEASRLDANLALRMVRAIVNKGLDANGSVEVETDVEVMLDVVVSVEPSTLVVSVLVTDGPEDNEGMLGKTISQEASNKVNNER
jgi:hypothetical protein